MKTWVVRLAFFLVAFTVLIGIVGARARADRALERADEVRNMGVPSEVNVAAAEGARSTVTATADVTLPGRVEALAWTFRLTRGPSRWSIAGVDGGEVPTGDPAELRLGRTPDTTIPTTEGARP